MKKIALLFILLFVIPFFLRAQYNGGYGRGDAFAESLNLPVGAKEANGENISHCMLKQNFPNPFSTATNIEFTVAKEERVSIAVYDITGCIVLTLLDELMKPGIYTSTIDGTFLNRGLYFCRLLSGKYSQTMLMILMR
jgi:hypothetical protein